MFGGSLDLLFPVLLFLWFEYLYIQHLYNTNCPILWVKCDICIPTLISFIYYPVISYTSINSFLSHFIILWWWVCLKLGYCLRKLWAVVYNVGELLAKEFPFIVLEAGHQRAGNSITMFGWKHSSGLYSSNCICLLIAIVLEAWS